MDFATEDMVDLTTNISGQPGPGPTPGTDDLHFTFTQYQATDVWEVVHNLGKRPSVTVVDSAESVVMPNKIVYDSDNQVTVSFLASFAGKVYLN